MTQRERMKRVVNHTLADRTPAALSGRPEVDRALMDYYAVNSMDEVHRILGTEGWGKVEVPVDHSAFERKTNGVLEGGMPFNGERFIFHEPDVFEDRFGVVRRVGKDRKYVQWIAGPLVDAQSPDDCEFPTPAAHTTVRYHGRC